MKPEKVKVGMKCRVRGSSKAGTDLHNHIVETLWTSGVDGFVGIQCGSLRYMVHACQLIPIVKKKSKYPTLWMNFFEHDTYVYFKKSSADIFADDSRIHGKAIKYVPAKNQDEETK